MNTMFLLNLRDIAGVSRCKASWICLRSGRTALSVITALLMMLGVVVVSPPGAHAEDLDLGFYQSGENGLLAPLGRVEKLVRKGFEFVECHYFNKSECWHLQSTSDWATITTDWKYPGGNLMDGTKQNAFKHCIWIGALATRLDESSAYRAGFVHEEMARSGQPPEFREMDEWNNFVGASIGADAKRKNLPDQWGYVVDQCYSLAESGQLYGPGGIKGGYGH